MAELRVDSRQQPRILLPPWMILALGILAASTSSILIRFAQREVDSLVIAAYRLTLAAVILLPFYLRHTRRHPRANADVNPGLLLISGFLLAIHFATWIRSLEFTNVTSSVVIVQTSPLFVALLSPLLLGEQPPRTTWIGVIVAITGSVLIAAGDLCPALHLTTCSDAAGAFNPTALIGNGLALLGALSGAGYLIIGRRLRRKIDLLTYITWVYGFAAVLLLIIVLVQGLPLFGYSPLTYLWLLLLALLPQLLAHSSYNWALRYLSAASVSISLLGEPLLASILAFLFLGEIPGLVLLAGAALVLGGIILAVSKPTQPADTAGSNEGG